MTAAYVCGIPDPVNEKYRCERDEGHRGWHESGDRRWGTTEAQRRYWLERHGLGEA